MAVRSTDRKEAEGGLQIVKRSVGRPAVARARSVAVATLPAEGSRPGSGYKSTPDCELINSLARGLRVLAAFAPEDDLLGNKDIAARTGIPKPSISRLTDTLVKLNFLEQDAVSGLYRLGGATIALGLAARKNLDLPTIAGPFMERFAIEHSVSVELGTLDGLEIRARGIITNGLTPDATNLFLGASFALDATALGLAYICGLSPDRRADLLSRLQAARGGDWQASSARIDKAIAEYTADGYCTSLGEWQGNVNGIGAPLVMGLGDAPLSICCVGRAEQMPPARLHELAPYFLGLVTTIQAAARQKLRHGC
jgi:DNA-binding IclR family transcriptional regulator